jgi:hypothetical protein
MSAVSLFNAGYEGGEGVPSLPQRDNLRKNRRKGSVQQRKPNRGLFVLQTRPCHHHARDAKSNFRI